jgi:hypothetical protein
VSRGDPPEQRDEPLLDFVEEVVQAVGGAALTQDLGIGQAAASALVVVTAKGLDHTLGAR